MTFYATGEGLTDGANVSGKPAQAPIHEDDGSYSVLVPRPGGGFISKPVP